MEVILKSRLILFLFSFTLFFSCAQNKENSLVVTNWNVQTFFDANDDGIEYESFRKNVKWNLDSYTARLDRLCNIIEKSDSDIFIMEEVENEKIIFDIFNKLSGNVWFPKKVYRYAAFSKEEGSSIGCAVLSRHEIKDIKLHSLDIKTEKAEAPSMRPVMQLTVCPKRQKKEHTVCVFVNHWKSKSGGENKTELWRLWQESVLASKMKEAKENAGVVFASGDFNKDIGSFNRDLHNALYFTSLEKDKNIFLEIYSPWDDCKNLKVRDERLYSSNAFESDCSSRGSDFFERDDSFRNYGTYYFRGRWEKIDHFFFLDKNAVKDFSIAPFDELLKDDGTPMRYEVFTGRGYSDHLPVMCIINYPEQ